MSPVRSRGAKAMPGGGVRCTMRGARRKREGDVMDKRRSIEVAGVKHQNPIPAASRKGPIVASGAISGADPQTGTVSGDLDAQCGQMFDNGRRLIEAAGGSPDDIVKMTVWIADRALRPTLNKYWVEMFP